MAELALFPADEVGLLWSAVITFFAGFFYPIRTRERSTCLEEEAPLEAEAELKDTGGRADGSTSRC